MTVIQRFGGGLNLNVHFHTLRLDGVLFEGQDGALEFRPVPGEAGAWQERQQGAAVEGRRTAVPSTGPLCRLCSTAPPRLR